LAVPLLDLVPLLLVEKGGFSAVSPDLHRTKEESE
jgi:hypothetical protein